MTEKATLAAGCFWGVEETFRILDGVISTKVGYTGGETPNPTYEDVCRRRTGHAEAVLVEFDPERISFDEILDVFWAAHDPTQLNRQGPDVGDQYRSEIYFHSPEQETSAIASKEKAQTSGRHHSPIVTKITPATVFYDAEDYHQKYFQKRGLGVGHG